MVCYLRGGGRGGGGVVVGGWAVDYLSSHNFNKTISNISPGILGIFRGEDGKK